MNFTHAKNIHFIGIGGIGVSALSKLCHAKNIVITGSDLSESETTRDLVKNFNIPITIGSDPQLITDKTDLVIYSPAIKSSDIEYKRAHTLNIPLVSYPEALGQLSKEKTTIAISGTNGKTTTISMLVEVMKDQGINPTVIIGGILQKYNSNFLSGDSEYFITEACEYKRSFLNIHHDVAVITNISEDHLDYFEDLEDIQSAFTEFVSKRKGTGILICNTTLKELEPTIDHAKNEGVEIIDYSGYLIDKYSVALPGEHNRQNMATTLATVKVLGLDIEKASEYLSTEFAGAKRRMEYIGTTQNGALLYDDYAHNPEGIEYLINALKNHYPTKKIVILFEPHLYSRTEDFKEEFGRVLSLSDILYLFPVYRAREERQAEKDFLLEPYIAKNDNFISIKDPENFTDFLNTEKYDENYVLVTVGAGDIWKVGRDLKRQD